MALSEAQDRARRKYDAEHYDQITLRLPAGSRERIRATGESVNGFIARAVAERLGDGPQGPPEAAPVLIPRDLWERLAAYGEPSELVISGAVAILAEYAAGIH